MSQSSNSPSSVAGVIESLGNDLAQGRERDHGFECENGEGRARGTQPRARRYSDRPIDLRLDRPSIVVDEPTPIEVPTTRMRRLS